MADAVDVAVVTVATDAEATIARAVGSALEQDHVAQVIVVDNACTDASRARAEAADDGSGRLTFVTLAERLGPAGARNRALDAAAAPYFCVLDDDDFMLAGRMARLVASAPREWDLLADDIIILPEEMADAQLALVREDDVEDTWTLDVETFALGNVPRPGRARGELGFLKPIVSRAFLDRHHLRYDESLVLGEDYALYIEALAAGARFHVVSACGYVALERRTSLSARHTAQHLMRAAAFDEAFLDRSDELTPDARAAVRRHRDRNRHESTFRTALDVRRARGLGAGVGVLLRAPGALPHALGETVRAKSRAALARLGLIEEDARRLRLLIGAPEATVSIVPDAPAARSADDQPPAPAEQAHETG